MVSYCKSCKARLGHGDEHEKCYKCLSFNHVVRGKAECALCAKLGESTLYKRKQKVIHFQETGVWLSEKDLAKLKESPAKAAAGKVASQKPSSSRKSDSVPPEDVEVLSTHPPDTDSLLGETQSGAEEEEEEGGETTPDETPDNSGEEDEDAEGQGAVPSPDLGFQPPPRRSFPFSFTRE